MNANYSEAIEKQAQLLRWWSDAETPAIWPADPDLVQAVAVKGLAIPKNAAPAMRSMVEFGDTYYWGTGQCNVLEHAARGVPASAKIDKSMFEQAGFYWFAKPLDTLEPEERWPILAIAYVRTLDGIEYAAWEDWRHNRTLESDPDAYGYWPYGVPMGELVSRGNDVIFQMCWRTLFAAAMFLQQRIFVAGSAQIDRHARKRLAKSAPDLQPLVRVVELRRREASDRIAAQSPDGEVEWSCQWIVRGHWRQQPYPKVGEVRPKWITPYVKGPDDKPLKAPRATVFAVVR